MVAVHAVPLPACPLLKDTGLPQDINRLEIGDNRLAIRQVLFVAAIEPDPQVVARDGITPIGQAQLHVPLDIGNPGVRLPADIDLDGTDHQRQDLGVVLFAIVGDCPSFPRAEQIRRRCSCSV